MAICAACGRDIDAMGQHNFSLFGVPFCDSCARMSMASISRIKPDEHKATEKIIREVALKKEINGI